MRKEEKYVKEKRNEIVKGGVEMNERFFSRENGLIMESGWLDNM
ncbi:MAG: hypothetical protein ACLT8I_16365 [Blautia faecis]